MDDRVHRLLAALVSMRDELGDEAYQEAVHAARQAVAKVVLSFALRKAMRSSSMQEEWKPIINHRTIE